MTRDAAFECSNCGRRQECPGVSLSDLHQEARSQGYKGKLNAARDAVVALCPDCAPKDS